MFNSNLKKEISTIFIIIFLFNSCTQNENKKHEDIIRKKDFFKLFGFDESIKFSESKQYKGFFYKQENSFCSKRIWLLENKTFESEVGCENNSHRQYGEWEIVKDTLILKPFSKN